MERSGASAPPRSTRGHAAGYDDAGEPAEAVLSLVPQSADTLTVTDWDRVRAQLGLPDLTSEDLMTDRIGFWQRAETEVALLTDGLLRAENSRFELDYGFTQDDVDWEARWTGEGGRGFVLGLRHDLDLAGVRPAVADDVGPLQGAPSCVPRTAWSSWAPPMSRVGQRGVLGAAGRRTGTATYLHRGCTPLHEALGPNADVEDRAVLLAERPVTTLEDLPRFALAYGDNTATVWVEPDRTDLFERTRIGEDWPVAGSRRSTSTEPLIRPRVGLATRCPTRRGPPGWRCSASCRSRSAKTSCRSRSRRVCRPPTSTSRERESSPPLGTNLWRTTGM